MWGVVLPWLAYQQFVLQMLVTERTPATDWNQLIVCSCVQGGPELSGMEDQGELDTVWLMFGARVHDPEPIHVCEVTDQLHSTTITYYLNHSSSSHKHQIVSNWISFKSINPGPNFTYCLLDLKNKIK
jgi:hypothetical protein